MAHGRLDVDCVRWQKAGAELINIIQSFLAGTRCYNNIGFWLYFGRDVG